MGLLYDYRVSVGYHSSRKQIIPFCGYKTSKKGILEVLMRGVVSGDATQNFEVAKLFAVFAGTSVGDLSAPLLAYVILEA